MERLFVWCEAFVCISASIMCAYLYGDTLGTVGWLFAVINLWNSYEYYKKYKRENASLSKKMDELGKAYSDIDRLNDEIDQQTRW